MVLTQVLANGIGAIFVVGYLWFLFPAEIRSTPDEGNLSGLVFGGYLAANLLVAVPLNAALLRRAVSWVRDNREPTDRERQLTYRLPLLETSTAFVSWLGGAVLFGLLNDSGFRVAVGIALAGLITSALLYLLLEGQFRPVFARALTGYAMEGNRRDVLPRIMLAWWIGSAAPLLALGVTPMLVPEGGQLDRLRLTILIITSLIAGGILMRLAAASVARPINRVRLALGAVSAGNLDTTVPVDDLGELGRLAEGFNDLVDGLREREALRESIGRQVGIHPDHAPEAELGDGERRSVSVMFVDLDGYTRYAEHHSPEEVVHMLNRFFGVVVEAVHRNGGFVNKFEGDAAMCVFGAPMDQPDHADRALRTAEQLISNATVTPGVLPSSAGLASGEVLAGYVGTPERYEYTVIGDVVNVSARLCTEAKIADVHAFADETTIRAACVVGPWHEVGLRTIKGRSEPARLWRMDSPRSMP